MSVTREQLQAQLQLRVNELTQLEQQTGRSARRRATRQKIIVGAILLTEMMGDEVTTLWFRNVLARRGLRDRDREDLEVLGLDLDLENVRRIER